MRNGERACGERKEHVTNATCLTSRQLREQLHIPNKQSGVSPKQWIEANVREVLTSSHPCGSCSVDPPSCSCSLADITQRLSRDKQKVHRTESKAANNCDTSSHLLTELLPGNESPRVCVRVYVCVCV